MIYSELNAVGHFTPTGLLLLSVVVVITPPPSDHSLCSAGCVEFGSDVTSSDKGVKVMLTSQDKVGEL